MDSLVWAVIKLHRDTGLRPVLGASELRVSLLPKSSFIRLPHARAGGPCHCELHTAAHAPRFRNFPSPARPTYWLFSMIVFPRLSTVSTTPLIRMPSNKL